MTASTLSVGLDVGDSNSLLWARSPSRSTLTKKTGPAANPQRIGFDATTEVITDLVREAVASCSPVETLALCAGVAGAGRDDEQRTLSHHLRRSLQEMIPDVKVWVTSDARIALETAFGAESGAIVIVGTGSMVMARSQAGSLYRAGGWGYRLGDPGSGYAVGRAGLRAAVRAFDGGPETSLQQQIQQHFGIDGRDALLQSIYDGDVALKDAAPLVVHAAAGGDEIASQILDAQTAELSALTSGLVHGPVHFRPRIALIGGMTNSDHFTQEIRKALKHRLPGWSVEQVDRPPVTGALRMAETMIS